MMTMMMMEYLRTPCVIVDDRDWPQYGRGDEYEVLPAGDRRALEAHLLDRQQDDVQAGVAMPQSRGRSMSRSLGSAVCAVRHATDSVL